MHDFDVFNECVTDRPTDRQTDTAYYRDARTHLKTWNSNKPTISMRIKLKSLGQVELESLLLTTRQIGRKTGYKNGTKRVGTG